MSQVTVAVVGSVSTDLVVGADRFPDVGETVLGSDVVFRSGGKGGNQAVAAHRLGARVGLFAALGADQFGSRLRAGLIDAGLDTSYLQTTADRPSGIAMIVVGPQGQNTITVAAGANRALSPDGLDGLREFLTQAHGLILQLEIPAETTLAAAAAAVALGVPVTLNASPLPEREDDSLARLLELSDVLVVNETEARILGASGDTWPGRARSLLARGPRVVVVTLGEDGALAVSHDDVVVQPAFAVDTVDTTGAGDAFGGALCVELASGESLTNALRTACAAGALATTKLGAQEAAPTRREVEALIGTGGRRGLSPH
ncbi:ribokinase [Jiangella alkaliphila]|uniref:Ribokinase n=1 Tax=Jiangella alkaliphila TaxID=419479 RepID=A0A1H2LE80_9ACTN|nr:ribokinase [Jiangella alkaliphila]SDU79035.1 ribokinase [Jiangella alkaliphila]